MKNKCDCGTGHFGYHDVSCAVHRGYAPDQNEVEKLLEVCQALVSIHECRPDVTRDDYHYAYTLAKEAIDAAANNKDKK